MIPTTRILDKLDGIDDRLDSVRAELASLRTEVREVALQLHAHEKLDHERFDGIRSDIRGLGGRVLGVEDTSRTYAIDTAQAEVALYKSRAHDWRKIVVGALLTLAITAITFFAGRAFGAQHGDLQTMPPTIPEIATYLTSGSGRLVAAGALFAVLLAVKYVPYLDKLRARYLTEGWQRVILATTLACIGALATGLVADVPTGDLVATLIEVLLVNLVPDAARPLRSTPAVPKAGPAAIVLLTASLSLGSAGCTPADLAKAVDVIGTVSKAAQKAQYLGSLLDEARDHSELFFERHPNREARGAVGLALRDARQAVAALDAIGATGEALSEGDFAAALQHALRAYSVLRDVLERVGVLSGQSPGGAEAEGVPDPGPLVLPTAAELQARMVL